MMKIQMVHHYYLHRNKQAIHTVLIAKTDSRSIDSEVSETILLFSRSLSSFLLR